MTTGRPWMACVRVNRVDKAYFLHQLDGFAQIDPLLVVWEDGRPAAERAQEAARTALVGGPWERRLPLPGRHRLGRLWKRLRGGAQGAGRGEMRRLEALAREHPPSVVYAHTGFVGLRLLPLARRLGVPLVVHFHGLDIRIDDPAYQRALRRHLQGFDRIMVVGSWMIAPLVARGYDATRIDVVPMGAQTEDAPMGAGTENGAGGAEGPVRFVAVARMIPCKGLDRTIVAFARLRAAYPEAELHLVGDGPERTALERQAAQAELRQAVTFHGARPSAETLELIAGSDVLVHHALDDPDGPEAFGVVITEAMARGLPVIGTRCGGLPDQIVDGETGFLIEQNDVDGMAEAMARLAGDPALRVAMGRAGRDRARAHFDAHALARKVEAILLGAGR